MRLRLAILSFCLCVLHVRSIASGRALQDVYVVIYATYKGKTGHAGIAVDKYKIVYRDVPTDTGVVTLADTVKTGELVYYDFWPNDDYFNKVRTGKDIPGIYYKLPEKLFEEITPNSLLNIGIPHKEHYACDGLLKVQTTIAKDYALLQVLDSVCARQRHFNARKFNCSDFVLVPVQLLFAKKIAAREFTPFTFSTTPNKLYKQLKKMPGVAVLKNADEKTKRSFLSQRVLFKLFH